VLETGVVRPVGATKDREIDVRIIAATHRNLAQAVKDGKFREDLLYRLDVVPIVLPPLRDRREDIPELVERFLEQMRARYPDSPVRRISGAAMARLCSHDWPGNVRELAHVLERIVLLVRAAEIAAEDLPESVQASPAKAPAAFHGEVIPIRELEQRYAAWALAQTGGHRAKTAELLGVDPKTLRKWLGE